MIPEPLAAALAPLTGEIAGAEACGGGSINRTLWLCSQAGRQYFLKLNEASLADMFAAEAAGLAELARAGAVRVPAVLGHGLAGEHAYLLLEYLPMRAGGARAAARLGEQLAALHRVSADAYGWHRDNTIGSTPQTNAWCGDWTEFWCRRRLQPQLELAARGGHADIAALGQRLLERVPALLAGHEPPPSLLHGDLWGGNWAQSMSGEPVIFDPAVYYGDREADLAMTRLFGGFPGEFYRAYEQAWPLPPGAGRRDALYRLYHVLNHLNLFGSAYAGQAAAIMHGLLR
ncbi:MAG: fructosamine kinase family protein [Gammaproteobacteria bacterium]|nr:MAG: fructosamine kinase family protein [Gammaproteobacteria bacterium]